MSVEADARDDVARTAVIIAGARFLAGAAAALLPFVIVRRLTQEDFGAYKQIDLVAALLLPFLGLGLDKSLTYFVPRSRERAPDYVTAAFVPCAALGMLILVLAFLLPGPASTVLGTVSHRLLIVCAVSNGVAAVFVLASVRVLIATGSSKAAGLITAARGPLMVLIVGSIALLGGRLDGLLWGFLALAILQVAVSLGALARRKLIARRFSPAQLVELFRFGSPLWGSALVQTWAGRMDRYLVSLTAGPAAFAVYAVGRTSVPFYATMGSSLETAMAPSLARWEGEGEHHRMAGLWTGSIRRLLPISLIMFIAMQSTAGWVIPFLYTGAYRDSVPIVRVSCFALLFSGYTGTEGVLRAFARTRFLFVTGMTDVIARLALGLAVLRTGSLVTLAVVAIATESVVRIAQITVAARSLSAAPGAVLPLRELGRPFAIAAAGAAASLVLEHFVGSEQIRFGAVGVVWAAILFVQARSSGILSALPLPFFGRRRAPLRPG